MKRTLITPILSVALVLSFAPYIDADQACGTSVYGGTISAGDYAGSGIDCDAAASNLAEDMGVSEPTDCEGCPNDDPGCDPGTSIPREHLIDYGECLYDTTLQKFVQAASVSTDVTWDKTCSSCPTGPLQQ